MEIVFGRSTDVQSITSTYYNLLSAVGEPVEVRTDIGVEGGILKSVKLYKNNKIGFTLFSSAENESFWIEERDFTENRFINTGVALIKFNEKGKNPMRLFLAGSKRLFETHQDLDY